MTLTDRFRNAVPMSLRNFFFHQFTAYFRTTNPKNYQGSPRHVELNGPLYLNPAHVSIEDYVRLQSGTRIISNTGRVVIKKYTAVGAGTVMIPGSHVPTVGMPQFLSTTHVNDKDGTIVIGEDCWIGAGAYLLSHANIGRGCVVAAGSIVTKNIPPYAVVAGAPAKIIATRFTKEQIISHEALLYPQEERLTTEELDLLFSTNYEGKRSIGTAELSTEDKQLLAKAREELGILLRKKQEFHIQPGAGAEEGQ